MSSEQSLRFKIAAEEWEFEAIHSLNYKTFVEEIPQHQHSGEKRLVDKFHRENTYLICLDGDRLVGMLAMRGNRPFSLDSKLPNAATGIEDDGAAVWELNVDAQRISAVSGVPRLGGRNRAPNATQSNLNAIHAVHSLPADKLMVDACVALRAVSS